MIRVFIAIGPGTDRWLRLAAIACFLGGLASCRNCPETANTAEIPPVRRSNWWNYYQRGLEYSNRRQWELAAKDFRTAVGDMPGAVLVNVVDGRRRKTYGLHFLNEYFPNRELGVCYYYLNRHTDAEDALLRSLRCLESSRAKYYLNLTRRALLHSKKENGMLEPYEIHYEMQLEPGNSVIAESRVKITGTVTSPGLIAHITVNGRNLLVEQAVHEYHLDYKLSLIPGRQRVIVVSTDLAGKVATWEKDIIVDIMGPTISMLGEPRKDVGKIRFEVQDDHEISSITVNNVPVTLVSGITHEMMEIELPDGNLSLVARDSAGNETCLELSADQLRAASSPLSGYSQMLAANQHADQLRSVGPRVLVDDAPPVLRLMPEIKGEVRVTTPWYILDMLAQDNNSIDSCRVSVNGEEVLLRETGGITKLWRINCRLHLNPGRNSVDITIADRAGNCHKQQYVIEREQDNVWREELRMTACLLPSAQDGIWSGMKTDLSSLFLEKLLLPPRRLNMVERNIDVLRQLMTEKKLMSSDLVASATQWRRQKIRGAEWLIGGYFSVWAGVNNWDFTVYIVDAETSEIILSTDMHFDSFNSDQVEFYMEGLAGKLKQQLPALSTHVLQKDRTTALINLGKNAQLRPGMQFVFVPQGADNVAFAPPVVHSGKRVQARVVEVGDHNCRLEFSKKEDAELIRTDDVAVLR